METEGERGGFLLFVAFSLFSHSFDGLGQSSLTLLSRRRLGLICPQAIGRPAAAMAAAADVSGYSRRRPRHLRRAGPPAALPPAQSTGLSPRGRPFANARGRGRVVVRAVAAAALCLLGVSPAAFAFRCNR